MPVLGSGATGGWAARSGVAMVCANPGCSSGWMRLWRGREAPVFEGGWLCGPGCTRTVLRAAVSREVRGHNEPVAIHRHRVPLGLLLLSQGAINEAQLRAALARQRSAGGRLGGWLVREHRVEERTVTRALGTQWGCPVLTLENHAPEQAATLAPRLLVDAFGFLPLRRAGGAVAYVGFEDRVDRCINFAMERMLGLRVEAGLIDGSEYAGARRRLLEAEFPPARMVEAAGVDGLAASFARRIEEAKPVEARLVRMHDYFWLRLWRRGPGTGAPQTGVEDVLGWLQTAAT